MLFNLTDVAYLLYTIIDQTFITLTDEL